jgi:hypothetical protein
MAKKLNRSQRKALDAARVVGAAFGAPSPRELNDMSQLWAGKEWDQLDDEARRALLVANRDAMESQRNG